LTVNNGRDFFSWCEYVEFDKYVFLKLFGFDKPKLTCANDTVTDYKLKTEEEFKKYMSVGYDWGSYKKSYNSIGIINNMQVVTNKRTYNVSDCEISDNSNYWENVLVYETKPFVRYQRYSFN